MTLSRLTEKQRRFVEFYAADPSRNQTRAAELAGCGKGGPATAWKWLKMAKIKAYLSELTGHAIAKGTDSSIANLSECLAFLTTVQRARVADYLGDAGEVDVAKLRKAPAGVVKRVRVKSTTDEKGQVYAQHEIDLESAVAAAKTLVEYHVEAKRPSGGEAMLLGAAAMLAGLSSTALRELKAAYQASQVQAVDVTANRLEE